MDDVKPPDSAPVAPSKAKKHLSKHKKKYQAAGLLALLLATAVEVLPSAINLLKLKIEKAVAELSDAGR